MLTGKKILLGLTGSIAAYKSAYIVRLLVKLGAEVQVLMTSSATRFISPLTLSTLSKRKVYTEIISDDAWNNHVVLGLWADLFLIAPATANTLAQMSSGLCDNMITACYLSARCPVVVAPAMDRDMWKHPSTQRNIGRLQSDGIRIIPVEDGELASGLTGLGRMAEPEDIVQYVQDFFQRTTAKSLNDTVVLVTAGPTIEDLDPVRFIGNRSSGKMGLSLVQTLLDRGAKVHLVLGPTHLPLPAHDHLHVYRVNSAAEMAADVRNLWPDCQVAILAAAVADYTPVHRADQKIKKTEDHLTLELVRTEDIAATIGQNKKSHQISIGFALETELGEEHAQKKMIKKNFDFIVLNSLNDPGAGFQHDTNKITILQASGEIMTFPLKSKTEVAEDIVDVMEKHIMQKKHL